jgi:hypothetical protein
MYEITLFSYSSEEMETPGSFHLDMRSNIKYCFINDIEP